MDLKVDLLTAYSCFWMSFFIIYLFYSRKKSSKLIKLVKSTPRSLIVPMTCRAWPTLMTLVSCGTLLLDTKMSWSTPTQVSSVLPSILTSVSPSILSAPWRFTLAKGGNYLLEKITSKDFERNVFISMHRFIIGGHLVLKSSFWQFSPSCRCRWKIKLVPIVTQS